MKKSVLLVLLMLILGGPVAAVTAKEIFVSGIVNGENQHRFDPKPSSSQYLRTKKGGFNISEYGARYYCMWDIIKAHPDTMYARVELFNPANRRVPIVEEGVITPSNDALYITTPPISDFKMLEIYQIKVFLYKDKNKAVMIDHLEQNIKSHIDTQDGQIIADRGFVTAAGEDINAALHKLNN